MKTLKFLALAGFLFMGSAVCTAANFEPEVNKKVELSGHVFTIEAPAAIFEIDAVFCEAPFVFHKITAVPGEIHFVPEPIILKPAKVPDIEKRYNYTRDLRKELLAKLNIQSRIKS